MKIIVPKAQSEWSRWQQRLGDWQGSINWMDPWLIEPIEQAPELNQLWLNIDQFKVVICVSPMAAQILVNCLDQYWPMPPTGVHWLCSGPGTANVLAQFGLPVQYPSSGYTAEDVIKLAAPLLDPHDGCLVVKGLGGRTSFKDFYATTGQKLIEAAVYKRSVNSDELAAMAKQAKTSQALWLSSSFLGESLLTHQGEFWRSWPGQWWVSSNRIKQWCLKNGLEDVRQATDASVDALAMMLRNQQGEL